MKNLCIISLFLLSAISAKAQQLASFIPADAQAVATLKGNNITDLLSVSDFNQSVAGKILLKQLSKISSSELGNMNDLGIQLDATAYYFYKRTDSINYQYLLLPLADASKFGQLFENSHKSIEKEGNYTVLHDTSNNVIIWDDNKALIVLGETNSYYFGNADMAQRYQIPDVYNQYTDPTALTPPADYGISDTVRITTPADSFHPIVEEMGYDTIAADIDNAYSDTYYDSTVQSSKDDYYSKQRIKEHKLDSLSSLWSAKQAVHLLQTPPEKSILKNPSYLKSLDPKAELGIWLSNPFLLYGSNETIDELLMGSKWFSGIGSIKGHLYVEDDHLMVSTQVEISDEMAKAGKKIYDRKVNRKFLKYINSDKALGFMGYVINTEAYLEELPKIIADVYPADMLGLFSSKEYVDFGLDLVSVMLDEEAIGDVIKGDVLIVLNGVSEKEVTYTDYDYDENFNATQVQKTKMETIPDFLAMVSSDNTKLIEKLLAIGIKEEKVTEENGIYYLSTPQGQFTFHILLKDGIVFMGSSLKEINKIRKGTFAGHISPKHRKMIRKNKFMACFNSGNVYKAIPKNELSLFSKKAPFIEDMKDMGDWYLVSSGVKGNSVSSKFVVETPDKHANALKYLLSIFESMGR